MQALEVGQEATVDLAVAHDVNREVGNTVHDAGIGNHLGRHVVDNDVVVLLAQFLNQLVQAVAHQQLGRVGQTHTGGHHIDVVVVLARDDEFADVGDTSIQVRGQTFSARCMIEGRLRTLTDIGVDQHDLEASQRERLAKVTADERLTLTGEGAGEHDDAGILGHEVQVEAQQAEGLAHAVVALLIHHNLRLVEARDVRYLTDDGYGGVLLDVATATHTDIQQRHGVEDAEGQHETDDEGHQHNHAGARRNGKLTAEGLLDDADVGLLNGQLQGRLLTLVQQVGVQGLLDGLLAGDVDDLLLLLRHTGNHALQFAFLAQGLTGLQVDRLGITLHGGQDGLLHLAQVGIHLTNAGCTFAGGLGQFVALEHQLVVTGNLRLYAGIGETAQRRDKGVARTLVADVVLQVLDGGLLGLQLHGALACRRTLLQESLSIGRDVDQIVTLLETGQVALHLAQFTADEFDTVVDEVGRALCQLVLVGNDAALVGFEQFVQNILGTLNVGVGVDNLHQCAHLVHLACGETGGYHVCSAVEVDVRDNDVLVDEVLNILGRRDEGERTGRRLYALAELDDLVEVRLLHRAIALHAHVVNTYLLVAENRDAEVAEFHAVLLHEPHVEGFRFIEWSIAQALLVFVQHVQIQLLGHLHQQLMAAKDVDLVLDGTSGHDAVQRHQGTGVDGRASAAACAVVVLHQHHGLALIDARLGGQIQTRQGQAGNNRKHEPLPVVDKDVENLAQGYAGSLLLNFELRVRRNILLVVVYGSHNALLTYNGYDK